MNRTLQGIKEKLDRAYENIRNMDRKVTSFFGESEYPEIPHEDSRMFQTVVQYHISRPIPLRFSVLAGEVVHHLRSSLDHIVWGLSSGEKRDRDGSGIEFPIFSKEPVSKKDAARYERKVEGLPDRAKTIVKRLQPYNRPDFSDDPLYIVNEMDRFDKHRELAIVFPGIFITPGQATLRAFLEHTKTKTDASLANFKSAMKMDSKSVPRIAFRNFGKREYYPVVPGLLELFDAIDIVVREFRPFFGGG